MLLFHGLDVIDLLNGFLNCQTQIIKIDGLRRKVKSAIIHCLADITHIAISRHHDALKGGVLHLIDLSEKRQTVHFRHVDIRENDIEILLFEQHC